MTFRQAMNIANGHHASKRKELETYYLVMREPYALIFNMFAEKGKTKTASQLFPLPIDKELERLKPAKKYIPAAIFLNIFKNVFDGSQQ